SWGASGSWTQLLSCGTGKHRWRHGDGELLAETDGRRRQRDWSQRHAGWCAAHHRRYFASPALFLGRAERRSLDNQALRAPRNFLRTHDARLGFPARRRTIETGNNPGTGAGGITAARTKLPRAISRQDR